MLFSLLVGSILAGLCCSNTKYPDGLYAELHTNKGLIVLALEYEKTPMTVARFVGLAEGTIKNEALPEGVPFFDGSKFHRVVPGHVIQAGAPDTEGEGQLGYMFPNEIHLELSHNRAGILGMANGGPHTNGSQFYITLDDRFYLDGDYTVFGEVVEGMDVVNAIIQDDVIHNVKIVRCGEGAKRFRADTETFYNLMGRVQKRMQAQEKEKMARESATAEEFVMEMGKNHITPGFDQAVSQMRVWEKRILILPSQLGYGTGGFYAKEVERKKRFVISPNSTLIYEVELLEIIF